MNKNNIVNLVATKARLKESEEALMNAIDDAVVQLEAARAFFENADDPRLIDYAIFLEDAAKARYSYLLAQAKKLNIKSKFRYMDKDIKAI